MVGVVATSTEVSFIFGTTTLGLLADDFLIAFWVAETEASVIEAEVTSFPLLLGAAARMAYWGIDSCVDRT